MKEDSEAGDSCRVECFMEREQKSRKEASWWFQEQQGDRPSEVERLASVSI